MSPLFVAGAIGITVISVGAGIVVRRLARAGLRYRGGRIVTCPETQRPAGVVIDAWHAIATSLIGEPQVRFKGCSRWPERAGCGQQCLRQIQMSPRSCQIQNILRDWYQDKCCIWCGTPLAPAHWTSCPVLLTGGSLKQWNEIPVNQLTEVLASAQPLCFACYARKVAARGVADLATSS